MGLELDRCWYYETIIEWSVENQKGANIVVFVQQ